MLPTEAAFFDHLISDRFPKDFLEEAVLSKMLAVVFDLVMLKMPSDERRELVFDEVGAGVGTGTEFSVSFFEKKMRGSNQSGMLRVLTLVSLDSG